MAGHLKIRYVSRAPNVALQPRRVMFTERIMCAPAAASACWASRLVSVPQSASGPLICLRSASIRERPIAVPNAQIRQNDHDAPAAVASAREKRAASS